jgi:hypothetical protein
MRINGSTVDSTHKRIPYPASYNIEAWNTGDEKDLEKRRDCAEGLKLGGGGVHKEGSAVENCVIAG